MAVYLLALGAALLFGIGSVVQQRVASAAPPGKSLRPSLLLWLVRQPKWLLGVGTAVVGNVLSGAALGLGSVALVQPLLVTRLLFALPLSAAWQRRRLAARDWGGLLATAGGLGLFIVVGRPHTTVERHPPFWEWLILIGAVAAVIGFLVFSAKRLAPDREAAMLGAGAGMLFALQSAFTHAAVGGLFGGGITALLLNWTTYAVAIAAVSGTLLAQSAYEMAPLAASYPTLSAVEPLTGIAIGVTLLGTSLAVGILPVTALVAGLAVMTWGIYRLATSDLVAGARQTMAQRRAEEDVAELERCVERELEQLGSAVTWLERCTSSPERRDPGEEAHLARADRHLARVTELVEQMNRRNREAEAELAEELGDASPEDGAGHRPTSPEMQTLARYQQEIQQRGTELCARAAQWSDRFQEQRRLRGVAHREPPADR